ncbi:STAS domain-containing protein [Streptomyces sp. NPDC046979]|uniref:STAS domain-containing protein n=1 Tax=Streptomyces sp. NPDC046979 TaxID=3154604 RepID=UPI0033E5C5F0
MSALITTVHTTAAGPVIEVVGDLDYLTAHQLCGLVTSLTLRPGHRLVLDLAQLGFCDSQGISALIASRKHGNAADAEVILASVPANTLCILRMVGLDQAFALSPDTRSAAPSPSGSE